MKFRKLLILVLLTTILSSKEILPSNTYLFSNFGNGYAHIKDTGTSPLRYEGLYTGTDLAYKRINPKVIFNVQGSFSYAATFAADYYNLNYFIGGLSVSYIHTMPFIEGERLRLRFGGLLETSVSGALNTDLQNASLNVDYLTDLMITSQLEYDYILAEKSGKFLFLKYSLPQRNYRAFFKLDLPLLILNGRPEFAYLNPEDFDYFSRRYYVGGYKMGTKLGLKRYLKNGNIIEIAYDWNMYTAGNKDIYLLERASHNFTMAFYFKLN
ncbi:MAG: hypothetical protein U9O95_04105 [Candidatus Marinimicrobia bacterium]|nr:hypothetical protein [Candidatus Neomarinimicrobiota bacterium]